MTTGQYRTLTTAVPHGTSSTTRSGPTTASGSTTAPISSATRKSRKASSRVATMPRRPSSPYITVMVSTKTLTAREPDQSAIAKPSEITSGRPPWVMSFSSGLAIWLTPRSESTVPTAERMFFSIEATVAVLVQSST